VETAENSSGTGTGPGAASDGCGPGLPAAAQQVCPAADDHDPADHEHARAHPAAVVAAGAQTVRECDGGAGPVARRQSRLDVAADDGGGRGLRQGEPVGDRHAARPVVGGDGHQHALGAQLRELRRLVGPGLAVGAVERGDVDDEQVHALAVGPQVVDGGDHLRPGGGVEHTCAVGDAVGEPRRRISQRDGGAREQQCRQHGGEDGQPAHDDLRVGELRPACRDGATGVRLALVAVATSDTMGVCPTSICARCPSPVPH